MQRPCIELPKASKIVIAEKYTELCDNGRCSSGGARMNSNAWARGRLNRALICALVRRA